MYDRKTWIILIACGGLLAANVYFTGKNREKLALEKQAAAQTQAESRASTAPEPAAGGSLKVETPEAAVDEKVVTLESGQVIYHLSTIGGGVKTAEFKNEFAVGSKTDRLVTNRFGIGPIGALSDAEGNLRNLSYSYLEGESEPGKKAVFIATLPSGLVAKKTFAVSGRKGPGEDYLLDFKLELQNGAAGPLSLGNESLYLGEASPMYAKEAAQTSFLWRDKGSAEYKEVSVFRGGMFSSAKASVTETSDHLELAGVANHFFATAMRPVEPAAGRIWAKPGDVRIPPNQESVKSVNAGMTLPDVSLAPKETKSLDYQIFIGPRHNAMLRQMGGVWNDVMPYGMFWWVSNPLNRLLNWLHAAFSGLGSHWSWGLAIIALTIIVRTAIWPLYAKSTRSMKRMSKLQPEMQKLKEKYPDDPNRMNQEMMKLYRTYGVNPVGGCLPMLIQLPIFFGFYRMLQYAVELRHQGFLWVGDLSQPDTIYTLPFFGGVPLNLLPIVMAITSFIQMAMTPKTGDKTQQRIMMFMPLMFFFFCYSFASALALYWTTTNIFSIVQTWITNKMPEPELKERKTVPGKKTFLERMAEKQQQLEQQRQSRPAGNPPGGDDSPKKKRPPRTGG